MTPEQEAAIVTEVLSKLLLHVDERLWRIHVALTLIVVMLAPFGVVAVMRCLKAPWRWWVKWRYEAAKATFDRYAVAVAAGAARSPAANDAIERFRKWRKRYERTMSEKAAPQGSGDH